MIAALSLLVAALSATKGGHLAPRPHILFILQDDLGHYNVAFNANRTDKPSEDVASVSPHLTALAREGIILDRHYVHWHCSPSRRSFLTGRLPLHHGEELSSVASDDIDLRWQTIGQKLEGVGYEAHWYARRATRGTRPYDCVLTRAPPLPLVAGTARATPGTCR